MQTEGMEIKREPGKNEESFERGHNLERRIIPTAVRVYMR